MSLRCKHSFGLCFRYRYCRGTLLSSCRLSVLPSFPGFHSAIIGHNYGYQDKLMMWLSEVGFGEKYWAPCYRATTDGWSKEAFHSKCDNKGPTITLARRESYLFGGFSYHSWQSKNPPMISNFITTSLMLIASYYRDIMKYQDFSCF